MIMIEGTTCGEGSAIKERTSFQVLGELAFLAASTACWNWCSRTSVEARRPQLGMCAKMARAASNMPSSNTRSPTDCRLAWCVPDMNSSSAPMSSVLAYAYTSSVSTCRSDADPYSVAAWDSEF